MVFRYLNNTASIKSQFVFLFIKKNAFIFTNKFLFFRQYYTDMSAVMEYITKISPIYVGLENRVEILNSDDGNK